MFQGKWYKKKNKSFIEVGHLKLIDDCVDGDEYKTQSTDA